MTTHSHSNPSLHDIEKDESHEVHELNTGQFSKVITEEVQQRARAAAAAMKEHNAKNALGFPEDDPKYGQR